MSFLFLFKIFFIKVFYVCFGFLDLLPLLLIFIIFLSLYEQISKEISSQISMAKLFGTSWWVHIVTFAVYITSNFFITCLDCLLRVNIVKKTIINEPVLCRTCVTYIYVIITYIHVTHTHIYISHIGYAFEKIIHFMQFDGKLIINSMFYSLILQPWLLNKKSLPWNLPC